MQFLVHDWRSIAFRIRRLQAPVCCALWELRTYVWQHRRSCAAVLASFLRPLWDKGAVPTSSHSWVDMLQPPDSIGNFR